MPVGLQNDLFASSDLAAIRKKELTVLRDRKNACTDCDRSGTRRVVVFGSGLETRPRLLILTEAPQPSDEPEGRLFSGVNSAPRFDQFLGLVGLRRTDVYVLGVVACAGVVPTEHHIETCRPNLELQMRAVSPRLVWALGKTASKVVAKAPLPQARRRLHSWYDTPTLVTYHPGAWSTLTDVEKSFRDQDVAWMKRLLGSLPP